MLIIGKIYDGNLMWIFHDEVPGSADFKQYAADYFVINTLPEISRDIKLVVDILASKQESWIEVFGSICKGIHDLIDKMSVEQHGDEFEGAGKPMTAWYEDRSFDEKLASYLLTGGQGSFDDKIIVFIGDRGLGNQFLDIVKRLLLTNERYFD